MIIQKSKDLRIVKNLYWEQNAAFKIEGECSEFKQIKRGVRQGCVISPDLFNLYSESILRNLEDKPGIKVNGEEINNIRYADDTALVAGSKKDLQQLINVVVKESERMGLSLNVKKTKKIINDNREKAIEYKNGKEKLFGFFVGQAMKVSGGKANPQLINEILKKKL